jgi:hypothetical protein
MSAGARQAMRVARELRRAGFVVEQGRRHNKIRKTSGELVGGFGVSPSDRNWVGNLRQQLQRRGVEVRGFKF